MNLNSFFFVLCGCFCLVATSAHTQIVNGDFETGGLGGWQFNLSSTQLSFIRPRPDLNPNQPYNYPFASSTTPLANYARVQDGSGNDASRALQLFSAQTALRLDFTGPDGNEYSLRPSGYTMTLSQDLQLAAGSRITGWARLGSEDSPGFKDFASVTINGSQVWRYDLNTLENHWPNWSDSPWQPWEFLVPADGVYHLSLNIYGDDDRSSAAYFDNITVIPEPAPFALLVFGTVIFMAASRSSQSRLAPPRLRSQRTGCCPEVPGSVEDTI